MKTDYWDKAYADLLRRLSELIQETRPTICGLSTFLDGYVRLHEAERLLNAQEGTPQAVLARELFRRANAGIGGEFYLDWPEGAVWLEKNLQIQDWGLGGTGAQAAQMLAILGAPALMSLEDRSERQLSVIHPDVLVATKGGLIRCGELSPAQGRKPAHYIFEFTAGTQVGSIIPTRSSRTIVRFYDERLDNDSDFIRESIQRAADCGAGILSGFNEIGDQNLEESLQEAVTLAQAWRDRGLKTIHLEIGDYATDKARERALQVLGEVITSLGMSYSELHGLCNGKQDAINRAYELCESFHLSRLCVHADTWALAITTGDPQRELEALLCGCLLASTRAECGRPCRPASVPASAKFYSPPWEMFRKSGDRFIVSCASPYLERPVATIGLGDTFLAGTLLILGRGGSA